MSKVVDSNDLHIDIDKENKILRLSLKRVNIKNKNFYYDRTIGLRDNVNIKIINDIFKDVKLIDVLEHEKLYTYTESEPYIKYLKREINVDNIMFLYEEKEPWFEINISEYVSLIFDPLFSKINKSVNYENILYIPKNKNILKRFLVRETIWLNENLNNKNNYYAVLLKNIKYEYVGMKELNNVVNIKYDDYFILSKSDVRKLKINNLVL